MDILTFIAAFLSGICGAMGLGGGSVLILYLTLIKKTDRIVAGGVNLMFFLPVAAVSVFLSLKNKIYRLSEIWLIALSGAVFSVAGTYLAIYLKSEFVTKAFGVVLLFFGASQALSVIKNKT